MKNFVFAVIVLLLFLFSLSSCKKKEKSPITQPVFSTYLPKTAVDTNQLREIYYGLMTPVEVCNIFEKLNLSYDDNLVNPAENANLYMSSYKAAMNMGVYGVDIGYMKIFGMNRMMISYYSTLRTLSERINVPPDILVDDIRRLDRSMGNADTITNLMTETYGSIDESLRKEGNESTLGLMMMGGWIESMYIATHVAYDPAHPDPLIVEKIAEQKYSLLTLLVYMKNYYDDPMVVFYTKKLKYLDRYFNSFNIYYQKGDVTIDTQKQIIRSTGSEMTVTIETINKIRDYIGKLRKEIVTV
jgi:hypothetical protein